MAAANAYSSYRPSGLQWCGTIPAHWEVRRITSLGRVGNGSTPSRSNLLYWTDGETPWLNSGTVHQGLIRTAPRLVSTQAVSECHLPLVPKGAVVIAITGQGKTRGTAAVLGIDATISQHLAYVAVRKATITGAFLRFALAAAYEMLRAISNDAGGTKGALTCSAIKRFAVVVPPRPEQDQIVAYLRAQDAHIARLVKAKRDLIKLLTEQKLRIIDHAVTRGLDAAVALKPSGIEWLGDVPGHWEVQRLKNVANVVLGKMLTTEAKNGDGEFKAYLRSTNVQWIKPDVRDVKEMWIANSEMAQLRVRKDDLLVSEGGEVGRACMWNEELPECYIQNSVHRVATKSKMLPEFLFHQFFGYGKRGRFNAIVNRVSIAHLTREKLVTVPFTVPPVDEQRAICKWIDDECHPLDEAIVRAEDEIKLIREYRDRQIADVVTGQVDVRGWLPGPGDAVAEQDLLALGGDEDRHADGEEGDGEEV